MGGTNTMSAASPVVEVSRREFTPTFAGFCLLLTYVVVVTNLLGSNTFGPCGKLPWLNESYDSVVRRHDMVQYINESASACDDFYDHACGDYLLHEAVGPWTLSQRVMENRLMHTDDGRICREQPPSFWDLNASRIGATSQAFSVPASEFPVREWGLLKGFAVNGVVIRLGITRETKVYAPMLFYDSASDVNESTRQHRAQRGRRSEKTTEGACHCLPYPIVITYGDEDLCALLCDGDNATVSIPSDLPCTCIDVVKTFRMASSAPDINATIVQDLEERFRRIERLGNLSNVGFHVGGGAGHTPDVPWQWHSTVYDMWHAYVLMWNEQWGRRMDRDAWPMSGYEANALYTQEQDAVFILAGVLMPPFYSPEYDNDLVLGGIEFIMAHELGHANDFRNNMSSVGRRLVDILVSFSHGNRTYIAKTIHEDYADRFASQVISAMITEDEPEACVTNTTVYQFAQMWCGNGNGTFSGRDVHAPNRWRVNQTVTQLPGWTDLFCH